MSDLILRLDHVVLTVQDVATTVKFFVENLGMKHKLVDGRSALHFGSQKINLHQVGEKFKLDAAQAVPGSGDLCFITETPVQALADRLTANAVEIIAGPVKREGALGPMLSIYFRDPDANLIEVAHYPIE